MSQVILHHYPLSPYSEKIRLSLGLKSVSWNSVDIPVWTPRPKLTPMTGGHRASETAGYAGHGGIMSIYAANSH
jgi:hypothetical protein